MTIDSYFPCHNHHTNDAGSDGELGLLSLNAYAESRRAQASTFAGNYCERVHCVSLIWKCQGKNCGEVVQEQKGEVLESIRWMPPIFDPEFSGAADVRIVHL